MLHQACNSYWLPKKPNNSVLMWCYAVKWLWSRAMNIAVKTVVIIPAFDTHLLILVSHMTLPALTVPPMLLPTACHKPVAILLGPNCMLVNVPTHFITQTTDFTTHK